MSNFNTGPRPTRRKVEVEPSKDIAFLNAVVIPKTEPFFGPLVKIGNDGESTVLTFEYREPFPAEQSVIAAMTNGVPTIPPGTKLVCTGTVFNGGTLTLCAATR